MQILKYKSCRSCGERTLRAEKGLAERLPFKRLAVHTAISHNYARLEEDVKKSSIALSAYRSSDHFNLKTSGKANKKGKQKQPCRSNAVPYLSVMSSQV